ncbi:MAG: hypothetical protein Q9174_006735, partial [Haloplaca sp. 1 TL-2023]
MSIMDEARYLEGGYKVVVVAAVLLFMQSLLVTARCCSRRMQKITLEVDDYVLVLAALFTSALCAIAITFPRIARAGTQQDSVGSLSYEERKLRQSSFIAWMTLYGAAVALSKGAILLLYVRVFTTSNRKFAYSVYAVGFFVAATGVATTVGSLLQCTPIARNWDMTVQGRCINKLDFARYTAIPNVISGFFMLLLPLPMVWRLNITIQQKTALTATFLHGI